jgi:peptidoglycan/LPS O-acetylase OafA/YrhL
MNIYRQELDGIRFFSIIFVILYHANVQYFSNFGFLGVDIFFILSGYLITGILLNEYNIKKKINFFNFVERRIRRIIPAVLFLVLTVFIINLIIFNNYTKVFDQNLDQIFKTILFISNEMKADYFKASNDFRILHHTWSLSIEMQIYFLFSIFFIFLIKWKKNIQIFILLIILLFTGILTQGGANFSLTPPFIENKILLFNQPYWAGFFSIIPRIFEFTVGSLCAYIFLKKINKNKKILFENIYSFFGLFLIFMSFFLFKETTEHPSLYTVPLLIGTSLLILYCSNGTYLNSILSSPNITYLGKLSYSAYLFHVPVIFLLNFYFNELILPIKIFCIIFITFIVSYFSYNYVEKVFRGKKINSLIFYLIIISFYLIIYLGIQLVKINQSDDSNSSKSNFIKERETYFKTISIIKELYNEEIEFSSNNFDTQKIKTLIIGNSISKDLFLMLDLNKEKFSSYEFRFFKFHLSNFLQNNEKKKIKLDFFLKSKLFENSDVIIISNNFRKYGNYSEDIDSLIKIKEISKIYGKNLILTSNVPKFESFYAPVDDIMFKYTLSKNDKNILEKELFKLINKKEYKKNILLKNFAYKNDILFLDKIDYLCNFKLESCDALDNEGNILHMDSLHLSLKGAKYFGQKIYKLNWLKAN